MRFAPTRRGLATAVLVAAAVAAPGSARAAFVADSLVNIAGTPSTSGPGYFTGSIAVDNISATTASVQVKLTNTSPVANGGFITGFAYNLPGSISGATLTSTYNPATGQNFNLIGGGTYKNTVRDYSDDLNSSPFGRFDIGAAVGGDLLGTGTPSNGLAPTESGTFTFTLTSSTYNLNQLTAQVLMNTLSAASNGSSTAAFLVRFRGFCDGSSDKVVGGTTDTPPPPPPPPGAVPAPPAVVLLGLGALCVLGRKVRRRAAA